MDFDLGEDVVTVRRELRQLIADQVPPDFFGAFTDDPADLAVAQSFCRTLAERDLLCVAWPEEWGGQGASPWVQTAVREEMWAHNEPRGRTIHGRQLGRAHDHAPRHTRSSNARTFHPSPEVR